LRETGKRNEVTEIGITGLIQSCKYTKDGMFDRRMPNPLRRRCAFAKKVFKHSTHGYEFFYAPGMRAVDYCELFQC